MEEVEGDGLDAGPLFHQKQKVTGLNKNRLNCLSLQILFLEFNDALPDA